MATDRKVTVTANINGVDEEDFGPNEFGSASFTQEAVLDHSKHVGLLEMQCRWGGECRVELGLNCQRLDGPRPNEDAVQIDGFAQLFEGTSEATDDLDGEVEFVFLVHKGKTIVNTQRVVNQDEGGDFADIRMTVSNNAFEE